MTSLYSKPHPVGHFEDLTEEAHPKLFHVKVVHPEIQHWTHCYWSESESAACYYFTDDNAWQMLSLELYIVLSLRECQIVLQSTQELPNKRATDVKLWFHLQTFILRQHNRWSRQISTLANMFCFVLEEGLETLPRSVWTRWRIWVSATRCCFNLTCKGQQVLLWEPHSLECDLGIHISSSPDHDDDDVLSNEDLMIMKMVKEMRMMRMMRMVIMSMRNLLLRPKSPSPLRLAVPTTHLGQSSFCWSGWRWWWWWWWGWFWSQWHVLGSHQCP